MTRIPASLSFERGEDGDIVAIEYCWSQKSKRVVLTREQWEKLEKENSSHRCESDSLCGEDTDKEIPNPIYMKMVDEGLV